MRRWLGRRHLVRDIWQGFEIRAPGLYRLL
jgi:hypothetical protein